MTTPDALTVLKTVVAGSFRSLREAHWEAAKAAMREGDRAWAAWELQARDVVVECERELLRNIARLSARPIGTGGVPCTTYATLADHDGCPACFETRKRQARHDALADAASEFEASEFDATTRGTVTRWLRVCAAAALKR